MTTKKPAAPSRAKPSGASARTKAAVGRPAATTRETIEEAACELFLEQGYDATSVGDIASRAGVSRSSFFNYFDGKTDVLWGPVVRALAGADAALDAAIAAAVSGSVSVSGPAAGWGSAPGPGGRSDSSSDSSSGFGTGSGSGAPALAAIVRAAALELASGADASVIPVAASQAELMGTGTALAETGAVLLRERADWLRRRLDRLDPGGDSLAHATLASAVVGGVAAAAVEWMHAGTDRGDLASFVARALARLPG